MQIKSADDKREQISELKALLRRPDVPPYTRERIDEEIRNMLAGLKGERNAAYEIEFHSHDNPHVMTIHDLRITCDGRVAQIDHLIINRFLDIWVCESKAFSEGTSINKYGEWDVYYRGRPHGIASPIEQNKRHITVLSLVFANGLVRLPKRFGLVVKPTMRSVVLVSNTSRISRPKGLDAEHIPDLGSVIKCEQLVATIDRVIETKTAADEMFRFAARDSVERFARELASLHSPQSRNWATRFGLPVEPPAA
jgi:hypothetical protein